MSELADIWVVDDDEAIRFVLKRALQQKGYGVRCFDSVTSITESLQRSSPGAILTDIRLPDADGLRVVDTLETFGINHMMVDASGDWGPSDPGTLHQAIFEMRRRGHGDDTVETVFYDNPCFFLGQCAKFVLEPRTDRATAWGSMHIEE